MVNQQHLQQTLLQSQLLRNGLVFSACLILITSGYLFWKQSESHNEEVVLQKPKTKTQMIYSQQAVFKTKTANYLLNKTFIKVLFRFPKKESQIWLDMDVVKDAKPLKLLVYHPLFNKLKWSEISNSTYTLYQKKKTYQSIDDFMTNPPQNVTIAADSTILENNSFPNSKTLNLETVSDTTGIDYILTTFHPLFMENNYQVYETIVDASQGLIINGELAWMLYMPQISEANPIELGGINITYNQPKPN